MLQPGGKLRSTGIYGEDGTYGYMYWCPGCKSPHHVTTVAHEKFPGRPVWSYNGNTERPTFSPSILVYEGGYKKTDGTEVPRKTICHVFVNDGRIQFLNDCVHELAGQTVDMPLYPNDPGEVNANA